MFLQQKNRLSDAPSPSPGTTYALVGDLCHNLCLLDEPQAVASTFEHVLLQHLQQTERCSIMGKQSLHPLELHALRTHPGPPTHLYSHDALVIRLWILIHALIYTRESALPDRCCDMDLSHECRQNISALLIHDYKCA